MKYIKPYEKNQNLRYLIAQMSLFLPSILQEKTKFNEFIHQQQMDRKKHYGIGEGDQEAKTRRLTTSLREGSGWRKALPMDRDTPENARCVYKP